MLGFSACLLLLTLSSVPALLIGGGNGENVMGKMLSENVMVHTRSLYLYISTLIEFWLLSVDHLIDSRY